MTDAVKINLHSRSEDPDLWAEAEAFQGQPGKVYVFAHGSPNSIADDRHGRGSHSVKLSPLDLAKMLEAAGIAPETKVFLHSCSTGQDPHSFAREMTKYFIEVESSTRILTSNDAKNEAEFRQWSHIAGKGRPGVFLSESAEETTANAGRDFGRMKQFHAADYALSWQRPDLVDTAASELPTGKSRTVSQKVNGIREYTTSWEERDWGDEHPIVDSMPNAEKSKPIRPSELASMAKEYIAAISQGTDDAREQAEVKYPDLKMAFSYHDKMMAHATNVSNPAIVEKGLNQHIAHNIFEGKFAALQNSEQNMAQH